VLVDCGWDSEQSPAQLASSLQELGATIADVRGVLLTHSHHDHCGLAPQVQAESGAWLAAHADEPVVPARERRPSADLDALERHFSGVGLRSEELADAVEVAGWLSRRRPSFEPDRRLGNAEEVAVGRFRLRVLHTPGHSPGHVCFVVDGLGLVFTGDHVLSSTTPNVSVNADSAGSPLDDYLASLAVTASLGRLLALPGHEERVDVGERSRQLLEHHDRQLAIAARLVAGGRATVRDVAEEMEWSRPWVELGRLDRQLAVGETHAHLLTLERRGRIERISTRPWRWAATR